MRYTILLLSTLLCTSLGYAQLTTKIDDFPVELKQAAKGSLELHYCLFQRRYYFFVKKNKEDLVALSRESDSPDYYQTKLSELTGGFNTNENLTYELKSLKSYINAYNKSLDPNFIPYMEPKRLSWYGMLFTGLTNNPFVTNQNNTTNPMIGLEIELSGNVPTPRHSGFFQYRYAFSSNDFDYQTQEFAIGYRYRFVRKKWGSIFGQTKAATFNISKAVVQNEDSESVTLDSNSFDAAFIFGVGADFKIGKNSYITFIYGELFAFFLENQGNFPLDFTLGYKLKL